MWKILSVIALWAILAFLLIRASSAQDEAELISQAASMTVRVNVDNGGCGTGVILDSHHILTAAHVTEGKDILPIQLNNGTSYQAKVIKFDPMMDLALLETEDEMSTLASIILPRYVSPTYTETWAIGFPRCVTRPVATEGRYQGDVVAENTIRSLTTSLGFYGNSGGGLFVFDKGKVYLIGIVVAMKGDFHGPITHLIFAVTLSDIKSFLQPPTPGKNHD